MPFALIGGLAVSARTEPRFTRDVDLAVAIDAKSVDELGRNLMARGFVVDSVLTEESTGEVATLRLFAGQVRVDLLLAVTGLEGEACARAERLEVFPNVWVPVVTLPYLLLFKLVAMQHRRRRQDEVDVEVLLEHASHGEREQVAPLLDRLSGVYPTDIGALHALWQQLASVT